MKRLQIMIEEDLDDALELQARRELTSKAALIRRFVREAVDSYPALEDDPLFQMAGKDSFEPGDIDEIVYG